jgi:hypothetical protein
MITANENIKNIIGRGAEAILIHENNNLIKRRIKKSYRIGIIDEKLRKQRTRKEAKLLNEIEAVKAGKPKTEKEEIRKNQRIADLNKQLIEAKRKAGYYDKANQPAKDKDQAKLESSLKNVEAQIVEFERRIKEGVY